MATSFIYRLGSLVLLGMLLNPSVATAVEAAVGSSFSYQGELQDQGAPANAVYDFQVDLFSVEADGVSVATLALEDIDVINGIFTLELDFGLELFAGANQYWLEIGVRDGAATGEDPFTTLAPRQKLLATPYALSVLSLPPGIVSSGALADGSVTTAALAPDSVGSAKIKTGAVGLDEINTTEVQQRISGTCPTDQYMSEINSDGSVVCTALPPNPPDLAYPQRAVAPADNVATTVDSPGVVGDHSSITIGTDGLPIISYYDQSNGDLKVAHCNDLACSGGDETLSTVDDGGGDDVGFYTSIAIGSDGLPVISYYDFTNGDLKVAHCNDLACSGNDETLSTVDDGGGNVVGAYSSITIGSDGLPIISYFDDTNDDLKVAHCNDLACSGNDETLSTVDNSGSVGFYSSIAIGSDGLPIISYYDQSNFNLKTAHCNDLACSGNDETLNTVDNGGGGDVGEFTSIAVGTDGLPVISYFDFTNGDLKVAHCNDLDCSSATTTAVDTNGTRGFNTSISIGMDDLPVISSHHTNGTLWFFHCSDRDCSSGGVSTRIDNSSNFFGATAITIGADGLPIISYFDGTSGNLRALHCANALCLPYFRRR